MDAGLEVWQFFRCSVLDDKAREETGGHGLVDFTAELGENLRICRNVKEEEVNGGGDGEGAGYAECVCWSGVLGWNSVGAYRAIDISVSDSAGDKPCLIHEPSISCRGLELGWYRCSVILLAIWIDCKSLTQSPGRPQVGKKEQTHPYNFSNARIVVFSQNQSLFHPRNLRQSVDRLKQSLNHGKILPIRSVLLYTPPKVVHLLLLVCKTESFTEADVCGNLHGQGADTSGDIILPNESRGSYPLAIYSVHPVREASVH